MRYEMPSCFDMSTSKGSIPCMPCEIGDDHLTPHVGPSIEKVRLVVARDLMEQPRLTVNLSPYELGVRQAPWTDQLDNPFPVGSEAAAEWWDGWNDG